MQAANSERFTATCRQFGVASETAQSVSDELFKMYFEEHRSYHNLNHIDSMLRWLDKSPGATNSIEMAIWFHDAIYDPTAGDNEFKSSEFFKDCMAAEIENSVATDISRLILATDPKKTRSGRDDEDLLIDIDLSILGATPEAYDRYRLSIREEYSCFPGREFIAGRSAVLEHFLSQKIYATDFFSQLEEPARSNISSELQSLRCK